jgi:type IV pilus assembly protein PilM
VRLKKKSVESLLGVDIGVSAIKVMELDGEGEKRRLKAVGCEPTPPNAITNNIIVDEEAVSGAIKRAVEKSGIAAKKAAFSIPGPSVFSKRIHVGARNRRELDENILFEAANYIPHSIDAVDLDYQVLRAVPGGVEVLLVAVKNEIVASYLSLNRSSRISITSPSRICSRQTTLRRSQKRWRLSMSGRAPLRFLSSKGESPSSRGM